MTLRDFRVQIQCISQQFHLILKTVKRNLQVMKKLLLLGCGSNKAVRVVEMACLEALWHQKMEARKLQHQNMVKISRLPLARHALRTAHASLGHC